MRRPTLKRIRAGTPQANVWLAMLGPDAAVLHGAAMAKIVARCASVRPLYARAGQGKLSRAQRADLRARQRRAERKTKRWLAPRLTALLWGPLADLNPERIEHLAAIVRSVKAHMHDRNARTHALRFHSRALRLARIIRAKENLARLKRGKAELAAGSPLPMSYRDFLKRLKIAVTYRPREAPKLGIVPKEHDALTYYRRELHRLGIRFSRCQCPQNETRKRSI